MSPAFSSKRRKAGHPVFQQFRSSLTDPSSPEPNEHARQRAHISQSQRVWESTERDPTSHEPSHSSSRSSRTFENHQRRLTLPHKKAASKDLQNANAIIRALKGANEGNEKKFLSSRKEQRTLDENSGMYDLVVKAGSLRRSRHAGKSDGSGIRTRRKGGIGLSTADQVEETTEVSENDIPIPGSASPDPMPEWLLDMLSFQPERTQTPAGQLLAVDIHLQEHNRGLTADPTVYGQEYAAASSYVSDEERHLSVQSAHRIEDEAFGGCETLPGVSNDARFVLEPGPTLQLDQKAFWGAGHAVSENLPDGVRPNADQRHTDQDSAPWTYQLARPALSHPTFSDGQAVLTTAAADRLDGDMKEEERIFHFSSSPPWISKVSSDLLDSSTAVEPLDRPNDTSSSSLNASVFGVHRSGDKGGIPPHAARGETATIMKSAVSLDAAFEQARRDSIQSQRTQSRILEQSAFVEAVNELPRASQNIKWPAISLRSSPRQEVPADENRDVARKALIQEEAETTYDDAEAELMREFGVDN